MTLSLAFCLFAYRPYGGLQRDFLRIAQCCRQRGHTIHVWTMEWQGQDRKVFDDLNVEVIPVRRLRNHGRSKAFASEVERRSSSFDLVIGFNRIPGLDIYYAADPCYEAKVRRMGHPLFRLSARYRHFAAFERAIFEPDSATRIMTLSESEIDNYIKYYQTQRERFHLLPPGIGRDRAVHDDGGRIRHRVRTEFNIKDDAFVILMVGSGFRTKGLDRAIRAVAALPEELRQRVRFLVVGDDHRWRFERLARQLGVGDKVIFTGGRSDIPGFLAAADVLIHPAYSENTGTVLLEAIVAGLPVLTTDVCGYAFHVTRANAGQVLSSPFDQEQLNQELVDFADNEKRQAFAENGRRYGETEDLYSMPERAVDFIEYSAGNLP